MSSPKQELHRLLDDLERHQRELSHHTTHAFTLKEKIENMLFSNIAGVYNEQQWVLVDWHEHRIGADKATRLITQTQRSLVRCVPLSSFLCMNHDLIRLCRPITTIILGRALPTEIEEMVVGFIEDFESEIEDHIPRVRFAR